MREAPIIKVFPDNYEASGLEAIRSCLQAPNVRDDMAALFRRHGVKALVITPEYNIARERDTGKEIVYHVLLEEHPVADRLINLSLALEDVLGEEGIILAFDREHDPELKRYFEIHNLEEDPIYQVLLELGNCSRQTQGTGHNLHLK